MNKIYITSGFTIMLIAMFYGIAHTQQAVQKTNPMKVYMHYMPWFETPESIGRWGWHWTMNTMNPEIIDANGHRQIASHYYPIIGPYASRDKDVIEYHLLLMKLSGIDGILINWYGVLGSNGDINDLLKSSNSIISYADDFGIKFGVVMEDRFSRSIGDIKANMGYLKNNYFTKPDYIRIGADSAPLVCIFGPITYQKPAQWDEILPSAGADIEFLTLWYESGDAGSNADGEYSWVYQDNQNHITHLKNFYNNKAASLKTAMGSIYPGFVDFYKEGGSGDGYFKIPHNMGSTLDTTIKLADQNKDKIDMVQLVTFNDFGEGTIFEPTVETGFEYLKQIQTYTGVTYGEIELKLVLRLYRLRKDYASDQSVQAKLDEASAHLRNLEINEAALILNAIDVKTDIPIEKSGGKGGTGYIIYPNPNLDGKLNIRTKEVLDKSIKLSILDINGKIIIEKWLEKGVSSHSVNNLDLSKGTYLLVFRNGNEAVSRKLIVK